MECGKLKNSLDLLKRFLKSLYVEYSLTCIAWMILYIIKVLNLKNKAGID